MRKVQRFIFFLYFCVKKNYNPAPNSFFFLLYPLARHKKKKENRCERNEKKNFSILAKRRKNKSFSPNKKKNFFFSLFRLKIKLKKFLNTLFCQLNLLFILKIALYNLYIFFFNNNTE